MNKKFILFIVLFFIVLVFAGVLIYIFKFKTSETDNISLNTREFLIKAKDVTTNKLVVTNFTIMSNGSKIFEGITNSDGYEKILVPNDIQMLEIFSQNNNYYTDFQGKIGNSGELDLRPIGNISVVHVGKLNSTQGNIRVYVDTSYENRELSFCLAWSQSIIKVENNIYSETILLNTEYDCKINNKNWIKEETQGHKVNKVFRDRKTGDSFQVGYVWSYWDKYSDSNKKFLHEIWTEILKENIEPVVLS